MSRIPKETFTPRATSSRSGLPTMASSSRQSLGVQSGTSGLQRPPPRSSMRPPTTGATEISSRTRVSIRDPSGRTKTAVKTDRSVVSQGSASNKPKIGAPVGPPKSQAAVPIPPPSVLRKQVSLQVKGAAAKAPMGSKVSAVASKRTRAPPLGQINTPRGPQQVLQKVVTENRVEQTRMGEVVSRNIKTIQTNPATGETTQLEEELQQLNPNFPIARGPVKDTVAIVSEKNITRNYETITENVVHETSRLDQGIGIDVEQVIQLVGEENEDVQNALRINPPELANAYPERFPTKKKLQALRLAPENIIILQNIMLRPPISADDPLPETTPEVMSKVMNALDKNVKPKLDPETTFNTLFLEGGTTETQSALMSISSIAPGPLEDVVVPTETIPELSHEGMLSKKMEETSMIVQTAAQKPPDDAFSSRPPTQPKRKARTTKRYSLLLEEDPPWRKEDLPDVSRAVGALPKENLETSDLHEKTIMGELSTEIDKGIEYYLDCNTLQYCSRVQLRGSQAPAWFPGYIYALSDMADNVEVAKSPSRVLFAAWKSVQPEIFADDSIVYN